MKSENFNVLLVEDSQAEADLIKAMFADATEATFQLEHVQRFLEGLKRLQNGTYDVVLLDLNLPDSIGLVGFEEAHRQFPTLPIIILTNDQDAVTAARAVREGAQDYLIKREIDYRLLSRSLRYAIERCRAEAALRESEERYGLAIAGAQDGIWDWHLDTDCAYFSPRMKAMFGFTDDAMTRGIGEWFARVNPDDSNSLQYALREHLEGRSQHFEHEHRIRTGDGRDLWVLSRGIAVRRPSGRAYRIAGSLTDITRRKTAEERLLHDTLHDALTRLPNRVLFMDRLNQALRQLRRDETKLFAVLFFDLDRFKTVNDSLGHAVGDELLIAAARRLEKFLRPGDTLARLGGDEFAILLNDIEGSQGATYVADRIHELFMQKFSIQGHEVFTSASIGIAMGSPEYDNSDDILRDADLAMYRAKNAALGSSTIYDGDMHENAVAALRIETDLRRAIDRQEFEMHYQPIVCMRTGRIVGFEALLRWRHPDRGLLYPDSFITTAEDTGMIVPIGWWVLREACYRTSEWQRLFPMDPPLSISVNISGKLFSRPEMANRIADMIEESGIQPGSLRLEITENAIMDHGEAALSALSYLRSLGVKLHIDDFGTGYSSLSYLQRFSYDSLKIDRSFVNRMSEKGDSNAIVKTICALGEMLGMQVIAEGVETKAQLRELVAMRCPEGQGFWFAKPMETSAVGGFLAKGPVSIN